MAIAVQGTPASGTSTPGTLTYSVPLPGSIANGELLIVQAARYLDTITTSDTGWTKRFQVSGGSNLGRHSVFTKVADGTETVLNLTGDGGYNDKVESHVCFRVSGQHPSDYWRDTVTSIASTSAPNPPNNNLGGSAEEYLWIAHYGAAGSRSHSAYPTDYTGLGAAGGGTGTNGTLIGIAYRVLNASAEDPGAFTISASTFTVAGTFAIRPAVAAVDPHFLTDRAVRHLLRR